MDAAIMKQKAYIKDLFVQFGVPKWVFNPMVAWNISKQDASSLINDLQVLKKFHNGDLKEIICQTLEGKKILKETTKTIDEMEEEEQATYDPTIEDWLDQQTYEDDIPSNEWIHKLHLDGLKKQEVIA